MFNKSKNIFILSCAFIIISLLAVGFIPPTATGAATLITLDFEGLPTTYYAFFGNQNIGNYYSGVTFGPKAVILDKVIGNYNWSDYPPHSGNAVFITNEYDYVDIVFNPAANYVEGWFTFPNSTGYMEAYNSSGSLVDSASMPPNEGSNTRMSVSGSFITRVRIHDAGAYWTGDDIAYTLQPKLVGGEVQLIDKRKLLIPLLATGAALLPFAIGMTFVYRRFKR